MGKVNSVCKKNIIDSAIPILSIGNPFGRILAIRDVVWLGALPNTISIRVGSFVKIINKDVNCCTMGVVWECTRYDNEVHKSFPLSLLKKVNNDVSLVYIAQIIIVGNTVDSSNYGSVGMPILVYEEPLTVRCGYSFLGSSYNSNIILTKFDKRDYFGLTISDAILYETRRVHITAPGVIYRAPVHSPCFIGIPSIDGFFPVGKGQRQLFLGDYSSGKTSMIITSILNQKIENYRNSEVWCSFKNFFIFPLFFTPCVYVSIGKRKSEIHRIEEILIMRDVFKYVCIIYSSSSDPSPSQVYVPAIGISFAEWFQRKGHDVVIAFDDLSENAVAYREVALLIRRPPGREAYPGEIFFIHSSLLERASQLLCNSGGSGITALPIIETKLGDITSYIATNCISICDGQIVVTRNIDYRVDVGTSVSRVGSAAQTEFLSDVFRSVKSIFALFRKNKETFESKGDLPFSVSLAVLTGKRIEQFLRTYQYETVSFFVQSLIFYFLSTNVFDGLSVENSRVFFSLLRNKEYGLRNSRLGVSYFSYSSPFLNSLFFFVPLDVFEEDLVKYGNDLRCAFSVISLLMDSSLFLKKRLISVAESGNTMEVFRLSNPLDIFFCN